MMQNYQMIVLCGGVAGNCYDIAHETCSGGGMFDEYESSSSSR